MIKKEAIELLREHDVKPSMQRLAVMQYLDLHRTHPTVEDIYISLSPKMPTLSRTTIYNVLHLFLDKNLVQMLTIDEKKVCFDGNTMPHSHFFCMRCGRVYDIEQKDTLFSQQNFMLEGHEVRETQVYYKGICSKCLKKIN